MLETIKETWGKITAFLAEYDIQKISEVVRKIDWAEQMTNPFTWFIAITVLAYVIWKRRVGLLILSGSFVAFLYLLQNTLPPPGGDIPLNKILEFIGGSVLLVAVNVYFLVIREK